MTTNLKALENQMIQMDTSLLGDTFGFYYDKGLEVSQVDMEYSISAKADFIAAKKATAKKLDNQMADERMATGAINPRTYDSWKAAMDSLEEAEAEMSQLIEACDNTIESRENGMETCDLMEDDGYKNYGHYSWGKSTVEFLELYVDKLSLNELATIFHAAELQHENHEISWYHYLVIGISTSFRLAKATSKKWGWWDTCDRLRANKRRFQTSNKEVPTDTEASYFGEMSLDMESAIDSMRFFRTASERNKCSLFEAACLYED